MLPVCHFVLGHSFFGRIGHKNVDSSRSWNLVSRWNSSFNNICDCSDFYLLLLHRWSSSCFTSTWRSCWSNSLFIIPATCSSNFYSNWECSSIVSSDVSPTITSITFTSGLGCDFPFSSSIFWIRESNHIIWFRHTTTHLRRSNSNSSIIMIFF